MMQPKGGGSLVGKISSYLQIVSKDPHSTAFVPLAEAYRQIGLLDDALEAARMGTAMLPHFSPGFASLGRIFGQMGRIDEAMSAYARALSIDRQSQSALVGLARLHLVRGERDLARKILLQAAEFHPQDEMVENMLVALDLPRPWQERPVVSPVEEPAAGSVVAAEFATEPVAGEPIPTATLAEIYAKQGLFDHATRVYEEILRLEPDNASAARRLGELRGVPEVASAPRRPLEVFESWLQAIQIRRAHVQ
jgi:tetratricopeptide (TPR) repeat protein